MRSKISFLLIVVPCAMMAFATTAFAQDELPGPSTSSPVYQEPSMYDDKPLLLDPSGARPAVRDSVDHSRIQPQTPKSKTAVTDPKKGKDENDPLNFNFLYYIIQKFKASDLMME